MADDFLHTDLPIIGDDPVPFAATGGIVRIEDIKVILLAEVQADDRCVIALVRFTHDVPPPHVGNGRDRSEPDEEQRRSTKTEQAFATRQRPHSAAARRE